MSTSDLVIHVQSSSGGDRFHASVLVLSRWPGLWLPLRSFSAGGLPAGSNAAGRGSALYQSMFEGSWLLRLVAKHCAHSKDKGTRSGLVVQHRATDRTSAELPWELLHGRAMPNASDDFTIARGRPRSIPRGSLELRGPSILLILSNTRGDLDVASEAAWIDDIWNASSDENRATITTLPTTPTLEKVKDALKQKQYDIVHFAGHGALADGANTLELLDDNRRPTAVNATVLIEAMRSGQRVPACVILNACWSGVESARDIDQTGSLTPALIASGVDGVVSIARPIIDAVAVDVAVKLHAALAGVSSSYPFTPVARARDLQAAVARVRSEMIIAQKPIDLLLLTVAAPNLEPNAKRWWGALLAAMAALLALAYFFGEPTLRDMPKPLQAWTQQP